MMEGWIALRARFDSGVKCRADEPLQPNPVAGEQPPTWEPAGPGRQGCVRWFMVTHFPAEPSSGIKRLSPPQRYTPFDLATRRLTSAGESRAKSRGQG